MGLPGGGESALTFYGQYYIGIGTENQQPGFDPDLPWVSSNPDINSAEWENAAKVRTALSIAIDRQGIVDGLLHGYGSPAVLWTSASMKTRGCRRNCGGSSTPKGPGNYSRKPATPTGSTSR